MKRLLFAMLVLPAVLMTVSAAEKRPEFSAHIIPTKAASIADQFSGILPNRPPFFPKVSKVTCGEPFKLELIFIGAKIRNGAVNLAGKLVMIDPQGKKNEIPLRGNVTKIPGDATGVFLFPQSLLIIYEPKDPKGKCTFDMELTDCNADKTVKASASVEYVEKNRAETGCQSI